MSEVSFFTNCYEGDWRSLLKTNRLENIISSCQYKFNFKGLIINNVQNKEEVEFFAKRHLNLGVIDAYYFSDDLSATVLESFNIKRKSFITDFCDGYWYSIAPLTAIYLCKTSYLLYLTCDCEILPYQTNWIEYGKKLLSEDENFVINPIWTYQPELAIKESISEFKDYYKNEGFSDQCFLINRKPFSEAIYNEHHPSSNRYPVYSGHSFERRVNSYMRNHSKYRIVLKNV
ncbi:MAG: hypothetical protein MUF43_13605, partial [Flavobacterium sp.]|nr:hypothetical protein [Flavobacterium sp.]